jgi:hypothetical protein
LARVNLYIPDELKARMDAVGDAVNWSDAARPGIVAVLTMFEHRRNGNMRTAIERLRASKAQSQKLDEAAGKDDGRKWAESEGEYDELLRISKIELGSDAAYENLRAAIDFDQELTVEEFNNAVFGDERPNLSEAYLDAFIEGAQEFFDEVKDKL